MKKSSSKHCLVESMLNLWPSKVHSSWYRMGLLVGLEFPGGARSLHTKSFAHGLGCEFRLLALVSARAKHAVEHFFTKYPL